MGQAIKNQVSKAADLVVRARIFLDAWHLSAGVDGRALYRDFWDEYWEFWRFNEHALLFSHVVHMAALFEKNPKTINFIQLRDNLKTEYRQVDFTAIDLLLTDASATAKSVAILRSNAFAHRSTKMSYNQAFEKADISFDKLRDLNGLALQLANEMLKVVGANAHEFVEFPQQCLERLAGSSITKSVNEPHYHINLFWSADDDCWIADVPDLRPCSAHGDTRKEALENCYDAIEGWLSVARENGIEIPDPRYRPAIYATA
jgi:predicted RNase H-like HicB family nuclease